MTLPAPVMVNVFPASVVGPETMLKVTGKPEEAIAESVSDGSP